MKIFKLFCLAALLGSMNVHAQEEEDRGFFFNLGEKIMNLGGYSYLDLHKKFTTSDKNLAACLTEVTQTKFIKDQKEQELKTCKEGSAPAIPPTETSPVP